MTMPPSPAGPNYSMQRAGNGYAVGSLILSLVGFCVWFVGGLAGIILGIMGLQCSKVTGTGRGLSMAGIIVGALSLCVAVGGSIGLRETYIAAHKVIEGLGLPHAVVTIYFNALSKNQVDGALTQTANISKEDVTAQAEIVQSLGDFHYISNPKISTVNNIAKVSGTAVFANGSKPFASELSYDGAKWKITSLKFE